MTNIQQAILNTKSATRLKPSKLHSDIGFTRGQIFSDLVNKKHGFTLWGKTLKVLRQNWTRIKSCVTVAIKRWFWAVTRDANLSIEREMLQKWLF